MPEISDERLIYFEALEAVVNEIIGPLSERGKELADTEKESRFAQHWSDEEIEHAMAGAAIWQDRPKGWRKSTLLIYSRGELTGRGIVGGNIGQYFWKIAEACRDPINYWRKWRLGSLDFYQGISCQCGGTYALDEEGIGLVCHLCRSFLSYEQMHEMMAKQE
jgi:hypothetical protein